MISFTLFMKHHETWNNISVKCIKKLSSSIFIHDFSLLYFHEFNSFLHHSYSKLAFAVNARIEEKKIYEIIQWWWQIITI